MARESINTGAAGAAVHVRPTSDSSIRSQAVVLAIEGTDNLVPATTARGVRIDFSGSGVTTGRQAVATAGTAVRLASSATPCRTIALFPWPTNTQRCMVGDVNVKASDSLYQGIPIEPGIGVILEVNDMQLLYVDAVVNGEGVTWTVLN